MIGDENGVSHTFLAIDLFIAQPTTLYKHHKQHRQRTHKTLQLLASKLFMLPRNFINSHKPFTTVYPVYGVYPVYLFMVF
jgi:hypothetical protein